MMRLCAVLLVIVLMTFGARAASSADWVPRSVADLRALDKVDGRTAALTVPVGQSVTFGSLTITVQACDVRPPDQPEDATARLVITDSHAGEPGFSGWILHSDPAVSMFEHPVYDVQVVGCHA
jgi:hypothetical protein